jgi:copper resistance protein D
MMVDALSASLRALSLVALFQAAGISLFLVLFGRLVVASQSILRRAATLSALVAMGVLVAEYVLEAARMSGEFSGLMDLALQSQVMHSPTAAALAWRLVGLVLIILALRLKGPPVVPLCVVGIMLLTGAFTLTGHTATHPERWLLSLLLVAHLLVVTFWFGALIPLHVASSRESAAIAGEVTEAFSVIAIWVVPVLLVSGLVLSVLLLKGLAGLRTTYGHLLLVKLAAFAALMGLGALNKWRLGPAVGRGDPQSTAAFRRSLKTEYILIAGVLSVTAILTSFYSPD